MVCCFRPSGATFKDNDQGGFPNAQMGSKIAPGEKDVLRFCLCIWAASLRPWRVGFVLLVSRAKEKSGWWPGTLGKQGTVRGQRVAGANQWPGLKAGAAEWVAQEIAEWSEVRYLWSLRKLMAFISYNEAFPTCLLL